MTHDNAAPKTVTKRLRFEIFRRDGFRCRYCGLPADETGDGLTVDHVTPKALGGTNEPGNLVTACKDCNSGKTSSGPDEAHVAQVTEDAIRWAEAMQQAHDQRQAELHAHAGDINVFAAEWNDRDMGGASGDWEGSIRRFLSLGLSVVDLVHFIAVTDNNISRSGENWKYFCGCCWRELDRRQEMAKSILAKEDQPSDEPDDIGLPTLDDMVIDLGWMLRMASVSRALVADFVDLARRYGVDGSSLEYGFNLKIDELDDDEVASFAEGTACGRTKEWIAAV